jgi:hypothetical protein
MFWPKVSWPIGLGVRHPLQFHDQILIFPFFCRTIALLFVFGRPLWREDGSAICSALCQWSESRRTHNHTLLSHPTTEFPFCCLLRLAGITVEVFYPLWREDGSVICSAICQWSESRRTHNHTWLSHLRLLGSLSVTSYDSQGLRWKYSTLSDQRTGL